MTQILPKRAIFEFSQKIWKPHFFPTPKTRLSTKNSQILMSGLWKKCEKPPFLGILGQNGQFWTVFDQNGQNGNFFKKALGTFFSCLQALTNWKVSEKSNERFSSNRVTYGRTDGHTYRRTWILRSPTTSSREQKFQIQAQYDLILTIFGKSKKTWV